MIDSHAHVAFSQFDEDRSAVIGRAQKAEVGWIEVGTDVEQSKRAIALAGDVENVWPTVGVHPSDITDLIDFSWSELEQLLSDDNVIAVGEVGLDYYRGGTKEQQLPVLQRFVELARARELPMIFHVRDGDQSAHDDMIELLGSLSERPHGVMHTFSGTAEHAKQYLELGMHLSFSGVVTFKNAGAIADVARTAPLDRILIETDCPFLTPEPHRSQRNEPSYVRYVAAKIADLRGLSVEEVDAATEKNTRTLFNLS